MKYVVFKKCGSGSVDLPSEYITEFYYVDDANITTPDGSFVLPEDEFNVLLQNNQSLMNTYRQEKREQEIILQNNEADRLRGLRQEFEEFRAWRAAQSDGYST